MNGKKRVIRDYLRRREEEQTDAEINKKKQAILSAYTTSTKIPHDLKEDAQKILAQIIYEIQDAPDEKPAPRVMVTTSREPSSMLREFAKRMSLVFNGKLASRGSMTLGDIDELCTASRTTALLMLGESHGRPTSVSLRFYPAGPTFNFNVMSHRMRRTKKFSPMVGLIAEGFEGEQGVKLKTFLSLLFPKEKEYKRYLLIASRGDTMTVRHYFDKEEEDLRLEMKLYEIKTDEFTTEWSLRPFINTNKEK